jgi:hypothetical protein
MMIARFLPGMVALLAIIFFDFSSEEMLRHRPAVTLDAEPPACFNGLLSGAKVHRINEITKLWEDFSLILL